MRPARAKSPFPAGQPAAAPWGQGCCRAPKCRPQVLPAPEAMALCVPHRTHTARSARRGGHRLSVACSRAGGRQSFPTSREQENSLISSGTFP